MCVCVWEGAGFFFVCLFEKRSQGAQAGLTPDVRLLNLLPPLLQYSHSTGDRTHVLMHAKYIYQLSNGSLVIKFYLRCSIHILTGSQRAPSLSKGSGTQMEVVRLARQAPYHWAI